MNTLDYERWPSGTPVLPGITITAFSSYGPTIPTLPREEPGSVPSGRSVCGSLFATLRTLAGAALAQALASRTPDSAWAAVITERA